MYYADHLKAIHRKDLCTPGLEAIWLQVKFTCTSALFAVLYRPPDDNKFSDSVRIPLEKAWLKTSNIFLLGDMNCNLSTVNYSAHGVTNKHKLQSIMDDFHMHNVITEPTRRTITSCTLIDVIIRTRKELVSSAGVFPLGISDHDLIYATIHLKNKRPPPKIIRTRNYKRMDIHAFKHDLETAPFHIASIFDDPDNRLWAWKILFDDICNDHAPWKEVRIKSCAPPWLTNDIRYKMNERFKLFKLAMANRCPEAWSAYKRARNSVTRALRKAKASYFTKMFGEVKNSTSYWNLVNRATNPKSRKTIGPIRRSDDSLALQDKDKATSLNSYFATIGEKLNNLLPPPVTTHPVPDGLALGEVPQLSEFRLSEIAEKRKVRELQVKKSMGPDNIHPKLLKNLRARRLHQHC